MSGDCLFCRIGRGEIACHAVHEDDEVLAFLDIHPIRTGHTLVIPRRHYPWFEETPPSVAGRITMVAQRLAREMKQLYGVERVAMLYTGIHIAHAHAHVVPMHHIHDITSAAYLGDGPEAFAMPPKASDQALGEVAAILKGRL
jgi:histidine triad (HIT) family protein